MGVCINYKLGQQEENVKSTLDLAEVVAEKIKTDQSIKFNIDFEIKRLSDKELVINIGGCESLVFDFKSVKEIKEKGKGEWDYEDATLLEDNGIAKLDDKLFYTSGFCKTQFADNVIEHKWVSDIIKVVASRCRLSDVYDEGDYYHSGKIEDAEGNIHENGVLIDSISGMLGGLGYKEENIIKGETKI